MREYVVKINDLPHTMQLSDEDAKRYGDNAEPVETKEASAPKNKGRRPATKSADDETADDETAEG